MLFYWNPKWPVYFVIPRLSIGPYVCLLTWRMEKYRET